ncbi:hypothetical protein [Nitrobacter vulgaris]|nr:hypothetical protein [Nitrobacter vulgaris]
MRDLLFPKRIRYDQSSDRRPQIAVAGSDGLPDRDLKVLGLRLIVRE